MDDSIDDEEQSESVIDEVDEAESDLNEENQSENETQPTGSESTVSTLENDDSYNGRDVPDQQSSDDDFTDHELDESIAKLKKTGCFGSERILRSKTNASSLRRPSGLSVSKKLKFSSSESIYEDESKENTKPTCSKRHIIQSDSDEGSDVESASLKKRKTLHVTESDLETSDDLNSKASSPNKINSSSDSNLPDLALTPVKKTRRVIDEYNEYE